MTTKPAIAPRSTAGQSTSGRSFIRSFTSAHLAHELGVAACQLAHRDTEPVVQQAQHRTPLAHEHAGREHEVHDTDSYALERAQVVGEHGTEHELREEQDEEPPRLA